MKNLDIIPEIYARRFGDDEEALFFANRLLECVIFGARPEISPAIWQDVEIYIRFKKRDVWSLNNEQFRCAFHGIMMYRIKYVLDHLSKEEILEIFNRFYTDDKCTLMELFEKKFNAPIDALFLTQEKRVVTKADLGDDLAGFDKIFAYPNWLEFDNEANELIFEKILNDELTDEQMDYFLGASDDMRGYDQWFKVAKHMLTTTHDPHLFWTAGDVLSVVWKACPDDEKCRKWFRDQVFEIFWPRVRSIWPMENEEKIDFERDDGSRIMRDAIGWLGMLKDLHERLPELDEDYEVADFLDSGGEFVESASELVDMVNTRGVPRRELIDGFFNLSDLVEARAELDQLRTIAEDNLMPVLKAEDEGEEYLVGIEGAVRHAERFVDSLEREGKNLAKYAMSFE